MPWPINIATKRTASVRSARSARLVDEQPADRRRHQHPHNQPEHQTTERGDLRHHALPPASEQYIDQQQQHGVQHLGGARQLPSLLRGSARCPVPLVIWWGISCALV
jgi:hypothetical protein